MLSFTRFQQQLDRLHEQEGLRTLQTAEPGKTSEVRLQDGRRVINFSGNDYLGLSQHPALRHAAQQALKQYGTGAGSSQLISGHTLLTQQLEATVAQWKQTEAALITNSGYQGHMAVLQGLLQAGDVVYADKLNHASLVDGVLLANAHTGGKITSLRYRHLDLNDLEAKLKAQQIKRKPGSHHWIITDTVFSMDGDLADLNALADLSERYEAFFVVDEAHASGIYGDDRSSGLAEAQGVCDRVTLHLGTFSKALGSFGGYVAGPDILIQMLVNRARGLIYSTALPPSVIATNLAAVQWVKTHPQAKEQLWNNIAWLTPPLTLWTQAQETLEPVTYGASPIFPIITRDTTQTMKLSEALMEEGFWVHAIRPPTVPETKSRLRLSVSAAHTSEQLSQLVFALQKSG